MKKAIILIFSVVILLNFNSCNNSTSYSGLQDQEKANIEAYIQRNNIEVVTTKPKDNEWGTNKYYKSPTGLYFHLVNVGDSNIAKIAAKSKVSIRYIEYDIDVNNTVRLRNWDPIDFPSPLTLIYGDSYSNSGIGSGIQEAVGYMKNFNSVAKIIVPSAINTSTYKNAVTPVRYDLKITNIQ